MTTAILSLLFGAIVGLSLALTGGGGSMLAVPLLVYGLSIAPHDAVGISLAAVGATALLGTIQRIAAGQVEFRAGVLFAVAGMFGAPLGSWLSGNMPEGLLLFAFATLMLVVAVRMWQAGSIQRQSPQCPEEEDSTCRRDSAGHLLLTTRCAVLLSLVGIATGVFSGMFGVGGGLIIVPALIFFSGMQFQHAVATSLLVIAMISISGVTAHLVAGRDISLPVTFLFIAGGLLGLLAGNRIGKNISGNTLQKGFAVAIALVALWVIVRSTTPG